MKGAAGGTAILLAGPLMMTRNGYKTGSLSRVILFGATILIVAYYKFSGGSFGALKGFGLGLGAGIVGCTAMTLGGVATGKNL